MKYLTIFLALIVVGQLVDKFAEGQLPSAKQEQRITYEAQHAKELEVAKHYLSQVPTTAESPPVPARQIPTENLSPIPTRSITPQDIHDNYYEIHFELTRAFAERMVSVGRLRDASDSMNVAGASFQLATNILRLYGIEPQPLPPDAKQAPKPKAMPPAGKADRNAQMWRCLKCGQSCVEWQAHTLPNWYTCPSCGAKYFSG